MNTKSCLQLPDAFDQVRTWSKGLVLTGGLLATVALPLQAQITVDGTRDAAYGSPLALQTIQTGFGDSTIGDGTSAGGSELDAVYGVVQSGSLYLFLAGNVEAGTTANHINIFIDSGQPGQNTLNISSGTEAAMNGSIFSSGFNASLMLDANDYQGTLYMDQVALSPGGGTQSFLGGVPLTSGIGTASFGSYTIGFNNQNAAGVGGNTGTAANQAAAGAVTTGLELAIPLSLLGNPAGNILVLADINGGGDGYLSNQFLPGLAVGTGNVGGSTSYSVSGNSSAFDLSSAASAYVTVPVPEPASLALAGFSGLLMLLASRRRR